MELHLLSIVSPKLVIFVRNDTLKQNLYDAFCELA